MKLLKEILIGFGIGMIFLVLAAAVVFILAVAKGLGGV